MAEGNPDHPQRHAPGRLVRAQKLPTGPFSWVSPLLTCLSAPFARLSHLAPPTGSWLPFQLQSGPAAATWPPPHPTCFHCSIRHQWLFPCGSFLTVLREEIRWPCLPFCALHAPCLSACSSHLQYHVAGRMGPFGILQSHTPCSLSF